MQSASYHLFHSAEGSSWTKKDHKYIRKEGNRYIYAEDGNRKGKLVSRVKDINGESVRTRGYAANRSIIPKSKMYNQESGERIHKNSKSALPTAPNQNGNITAPSGSRVTPSEYRALVASNSKSLNKDGTLRANSSAARGDVESSLGDKTISTSKTSSRSTGSRISSDRGYSVGPVQKTNGLRISNPATVGGTLSYQGQRARNSHGLTGSVRKQGPKEQGEGMSYQDLLRKKRKKNSTSQSGKITLREASSQINAGMKAVNNLFNRLNQ